MAETIPEFGERLAKATKDAGMTKQQLAEAMGMKPPALSRYYAGQIPAWYKLLELTEKLNVSCDWLLTGESPPSRNEKPPGTGPMNPDQVGQGSLTDQEEELLAKALEVLRAGNQEGSFDKALKSSIEALHTAVKNASESEKKAAGSQRAMKAKRGEPKDATL